jgi:hypothetical protein
LIPVSANHAVPSGYLTKPIDVTELLTLVDLTLAAGIVELL